MAAVSAEMHVRKRPGKAADASSSRGHRPPPSNAPATRSGPGPSRCSRRAPGCGLPATWSRPTGEVGPFGPRGVWGVDPLFGNDLLRDCEVQRMRRRLCFRRNRVRPTNYRSCNAMVSKSNLFMHRQTVRIKKRGFEVIARTLSLRLDHCVVQGGKSCFDRRYGRALRRCNRRCGFPFLPQRASGRGQYQGRNCNPSHDRL
jgi:hypothetical protein